MTSVKSLKPSGVPKGEADIPSGYRHRIHRSKKNRAKHVSWRRSWKMLKDDLMKKWEKRHKEYE